MTEPRPSFGQELRRRRLERGLSLNDLARIAYYSKGHLSKIENGRALPPFDQAWHLDSVLAADGELARLLSGTPPAMPAAAPSGLPNGPQSFVGRGEELATLVSRLSAPSGDPGGEPVCVIDGMAGVGKTALAINVARALAGRFPDGCLFLDLRGYTGNVPPLTAAEALDRLLRRLDLPVPADPDERSARFRAHLARRRVLLVLDNAIHSDQVRPLIPALSASRILVTSRGRLSSLDEAFHLGLDPLPQEEGVRFFRAILDTEAEQEHVERIVRLCDGLPLALVIMAARSRLSPIEELASSAAETGDRLAEIEDGERSVRSAFEVSYRALPGHLREILGLLGLLPGADWTAHHLAALAGCDLASARRYLERLVGARLVERNSDWRFEFHDLIGDFARHKAHSILPEPVREAARSRLVAWSLDMTARADAQITPERYRPPVEPTGHRAPFADETSAYAWLTAEQRNLVATCRLAYEIGDDSACWRLAALLRGHFFLTKQWDDWLATHTWALAAAERARDPDGEAMTRNNLGLALMEIGRLDEADAQFRVVMDRLPAAGNGHARANALANHAGIAYLRGDHEESLRLNEEALTFYTEHRKERNRAITLRSIGLVELELGRYDQAIAHMTMAYEAFRDPPRQPSIDAVMAVNCLGEAWLRAGDLDRAESWLARGVKDGRDCHSPYEEARALRGLGEVAFARGRREEAEEHWRAALAQFRRLGAPEAAAVADRIAAL